jgi:hypothetical protein
MLSQSYLSLPRLDGNIIVYNITTIPTPTVSNINITPDTISINIPIGIVNKDIVIDPILRNVASPPIVNAQSVRPTILLYK